MLVLGMRGETGHVWKVIIVLIEGKGAQMSRESMQNCLACPWSERTTDGRAVTLRGGGRLRER